MYDLIGIVSFQSLVDGYVVHGLDGILLLHCRNLDGIHLGIVRMKKDV